ncbi:MAG: PHP domain-containing protein [Anaerohalosphaera sp.]|nr:PHP domain-containing protein [Anaerohalosphaera sp.]
MIDYDLHTHTFYCGHAPASMTVENILKRADDLGLSTIAITDHVFKEDDLPVIDRIRDEASNIDTNCRVIIGAEVDADFNHFDGRLVTDKLDSIDYIIASLHFLPGVGSYPRTPDDNPLGPELLIERWRSTLFGVVSNPKVNTLAHPARMIAASVDLDVYWDEVLSNLEIAAEISAANNVAWELNELTGYRLTEFYQQQWHKTIQLALNKGVKIIYGSDAHTPEAILLKDFTEYILEQLPPDALSRPEDILQPND